MPFTRIVQMTQVEGYRWARVGAQLFLEGELGERFQYKLRGGSYLKKSPKKVTNDEQNSVSN